ncbi:Coiled-coil domain-containing protein 25 [Eumeta japonica]|uniref:Coiled-coil domain-containing protein 25 n=1 Tax=Eumeta variegata TaxID=151549 RepID=A0A4C1VRD2_EUMVA|nr:Coiled-coil domain-containing protein 25 [Eumeta japonica]
MLKSRAEASDCRSSGPCDLSYHPPFLILPGSQQARIQGEVMGIMILLRGQTIDDIPSSVLDDACQLVKANSIMGNKMNDVDIVYTMWTNLKKTLSMEVGQVAFHKEKEVKKVRVAKRDNIIINRLNKTKEELFPDLRQERENRDKSEREDKKKLLRAQKEKEKEEEKRKQEEAELRSYSTLMKTENMTTNYDGNDSDDFM